MRGSNRRTDVSDACGTSLLLRWDTLPSLMGGSAVASERKRVVAKQRRGRSQLEGGVAASPGRLAANRNPTRARTAGACAKRYAILPADESRVMFGIPWDDRTRAAFGGATRISAAVCYCSFLGECWVSAGGLEHPRVDACPSAAR